VGALIDESVVEYELFVKQVPAAADDNDGTNDLPLRTIQAAVERAMQLAQSGYGVKVHVFPGIYREQIVMRQELGVFNACIIIESWDAGDAIVSGADVLDAWQVEDELAFERRWPYTIADPQVEAYPDLMARNELLFVEDARLKQVAALAQVGKGTFFLDPAEQHVFLLPSRGGQVKAGSVEAGNPARQTLLYAENIQDLIIRDMTFVRAPTALDHPHEAVSFVDCNQLIVENSSVRYNSRRGLSLVGCSNVLLKFLFTDHNGWAGLKAKDCVNLLLQGSEAEMNGWRLLDAGYADAHTIAAVDIDNVQELSIQGLRVSENRSSGLRLRAIEEQAALSKLFVAGNNGRGVELSGGNFELTFSNILRNHGTGLFVDADLLVKGTVIFDNTGIQVDAQRLRAQNNIVGTYTPATPIMRVADVGANGLELDRNLYHAPAKQPFLYAGTPVVFADWQVLTGQDLTSIQGDPQFVDPAAYDYVPLPDSPWYSLPNQEPRGVTAEQTEAARARLP